MYRKLAQKWVVFAFTTADGEPAITQTLTTLTATVRKDGGTSQAIDDVSANPAALAGGYYAFSLSADETDAGQLTLLPVSSNSLIQVVGVPATVFTFDHVLCGTCTTGATTTTVETLLDTAPWSMVTAGALNGRVLIFDADTTTTALRQQAAEIIGQDSAGKLTFASGAFTSLHAAADTFKIY